ncbi:hypothetical protein [Amycolatopsis sp. cmx-4-54]|uniref:hypothetical protein n=1 Tax=Amycolatopsis sp. cmx-4-54 TaxID=2790936 RepID=UPI00397D2C99
MTRQDTRPADEVLAPAEMGACRYTRHSFARSFLRAAAARRWQVTRERWEMDSAGRGEAVYRIRAEGRVWHFVAFSTTIREDQRTDRVVAEAWDVTAALVDGPVDTERLADLRVQVPRQEQGRADAGTLVWTRANRSQRFFDYVVGRLAAGSQPDPSELGDAAYLLRSTAFYSNGKFGLAEFERIDAGHPLRISYRSQMLAAWLLRELSYDLVEHCARVRNPAAAALSGDWRRYFGLGNATGLGMVPYVINHPHVLDAWCTARELPLAYALAQPTSPESPRTDRVLELLARARDYFAERDTLPTEPYLSGAAMAGGLAGVIEPATEYARTGTVAGKATGHAWRALYRAAGGPEIRGVVGSVLVETYDELDDEVEELLRCEEVLAVRPAQSCGALRELVDRAYGWVGRFDFADRKAQAYFWFSSENNEEPRRGRRGIDPGAEVEHPIDVARAVAALREDLVTAAPDRLVAEFLLAHPWHRGAIARVQSLASLPYAEVRANLLGEDFVPLHVQRFQLAMYGMENYSPQSTDWLRVTLFSGAPRATDVATGIDDDWIFSRKPGKD